MSEPKKIDVKEKIFEKHIEDCVLQYFNEIFTTTNKYSNATRVQVTVGPNTVSYKRTISKEIPVPTIITKILGVDNTVAVESEIKIDKKTRRTIIYLKGANHEDVGELQAEETYTGKADSTIRKRKISYKLFSRFTWFGLKRKIESWGVKKILEEFAKTDKHVSQAPEASVDEWETLIEGKWVPKDFGRTEG